MAHECLYGTVWMHSDVWMCVCVYIGISLCRYSGVHVKRQARRYVYECLMNVSSAGTGRKGPSGPSCM